MSPFTRNKMTTLSIYGNTTNVVMERRRTYFNLRCEDWFSVTIKKGIAKYIETIPFIANQYYYTMKPIVLPIDGDEDNCRILFQNISKIELRKALCKECGYDPVIIKNVKGEGLLYLVLTSIPKSL